MKPYPRYKPTGLAWLPSVPEHWEVVKIKRLFREVDERNRDLAAPLLSFSRTKGILPFSDVSEKDPTAGDLSLYKILRPGLLLENRLQAWSGMFAAADVYGCVSPDYSVFRPRSDINVKFYEYVFRSPFQVEQFANASRGVGEGFNRLYTPQFGAIETVLPPPSEQDRIVRYLDKKTAAIDELVRAKERQIELLRERKQALVSAAVTGGLDLATKLKDSGVPWIGKIPKGWEVCRLKRLAKLKGGVGFPIEFQGHRNEAIPFIKVNALASRIDPSMNFDTISEETLEKLHATAFKQGSIVFAKVGAALLLRRFEFLPFDCCIDNNMMAIYDISQDRFWLRYALSLLDFGLLVNPGAVPSVNQNQIGNLLLPVPPLPEQRRIVAHLDSACSELDAAEAAIRKQISLLQELRTRLVSDAVTGALEV